MFFFFFFKQKTAYEMRISDWSSDVCSSDLGNSYGALRPDGSLNPADWPNAFCGLAEVLRAECLNTLSGLGPISERSAGQGNTELSGEDLELKQRFYSLTGKLEIDFDWATLTSITNYSNNEDRKSVE